MTDISYFGEFDGVQLGVFSDGTPFATARGLAFLCDVDIRSILKNKVY